MIIQLPRKKQGLLLEVFIILPYLEDNGNGLSEDCTRKIASRKATETKDVLTSHLRDIGTINSDGYVVVNKDDLAGEE